MAIASFRADYRTLKIIISAIVIAVALAACSPDRPSAKAGSADPNAGLKTGNQLKTSLLTSQDLAAKFKLSTASVRDSAEVFGPPSSATTPTSSACKELDTNVWIGGAGIDPAAFAQTGFADAYGEEVDAEIDSFRGLDAQKTMSNLRTLFTVCSTYKTTTSGTRHTKVKVVTKTGPKVGDDSIKAVVTSPVWQGGSTLVAVRVGKEVVAVLYSSSQNDLGGDATKLAAKMANRLIQQ